MRDFNFNDDANANIGAANIAGVRPLETPPEILKMDEPPVIDEIPLDESPSLRPFHAEQQEEESSNLPKIAGAVVIGLLIVGGSIYAYESFNTTQSPAKIAAMKTPAAPASMAASQPSDLAPPAATPEPAPPVKSASAMPAPAPEQTAAKAPTPGVGIGPSNDPAIDAPMTFTADNAPPPQQPGSSVQTATANEAGGQIMALQQPITAPNVSNAQQPTASVANNQVSGVTLPSDQTPNAGPVAPHQVQPAIQPQQ